MFMNQHVYRFSVGSLSLLGVVGGFLFLLHIPMWLFGVTSFGSVILWISFLSVVTLMYAIGSLITTDWSYREPSRPTATGSIYPDCMEPKWDEEKGCTTFLFEGHRMNYEQMMTLKRSREPIPQTTHIRLDYYD